MSAAAEAPPRSPSTVMCALCKERPHVYAVTICDRRILVPVCSPCREALGEDYQGKVERHVVSILMQERAFPTAKEIQELRAAERRGHGPSEKA